MMFLFNPAYQAHEVFIAPARIAPQIWRLILGAAVVVLAYIGLTQLYFTVIFSTMSPRAIDGFVQQVASGSTPVGMYTLLFQFSVVWAGVGLACLVLHKRGLLSVLGNPRLVMQQFSRVLLALIGLGLLLMLLPPWSGQIGHVEAKPFNVWLPLLPLTCVAILIQTGAEEVLFRGYLQQQLAARFRHPLIWMCVPSALFALGHYMPESAGGNAWTIVIWAGIFGMLMADLTARAGSLGPAMAIHFFNNLSAMAFTSLPDEMSGLALYHMPFGIADEQQLAAWLPADFAFMVVMWLLARLVLRR